MDSMVRFRCTEEEHARWFEAAERSGVKFSTWAREALDVASDPESGADCNKPGLLPPLPAGKVYDIHPKVVEQPVKPQAPARATTSKGATSIPQGVCSVTGYDYLICLCPVCKARRGQ